MNRTSKIAAVLGMGLALLPWAAMAQPAGSGKLDGAWRGTLDFGSMKMRIVLHLVTNSNGLTATLDSPDQGKFDIPATSATLIGNEVTVKVAANDSTISCRTGANVDELTGTFTQRGGSIPLTLARVRELSSLNDSTRRPQTPVKPYPYREEEVNFASKAAGVTLAGTLTIPAGKGPFPAVVLISGSGPNERDEVVFGHRVFMVLADQLTRRGVAVLRYDKRGLGKSSGEYVSATSADFADDAEGGFAYLKTRPELQVAHIGLIGHSEGGMIAPMVASRNPGVDFVVLLAGPAVDGCKLVTEQVRSLVLASGADQAAADHKADMQRELLELIASGADTDKVSELLRRQIGASSLSPAMQQQVAALMSPWYRFMLTYDPAPALRKLKCPVLALIGDKDVQVPAAQNLPVTRTALAANRQATVEEIAGINHIFQTAKTGLPAEYGGIEETMSPAVMEKVATWILHTTQAQAVSQNNSQAGVLASSSATQTVEVK